MYVGRRDNPFELGGESNFSNFNTMFNTGERSEPENNYKNMIKISGGGGPNSRFPAPPPPSGSAHAKYKVFSYFPATITCITK